MNDRAKQVLEVAKSRGAKVLEVDYAIDLAEPLLGGDARDHINDLLNQKGTFRTVRTLDVYDLVELGGVDADSDDYDEIADELQSPEALEWVFEAPADWNGESYPTLVFTFDQASSQD
jgi:hypothetical protein